MYRTNQRSWDPSCISMKMTNYRFHFLLLMHFITHVILKKIVEPKISQLDLLHNQLYAVIKVGSTKKIRKYMKFALLKNVVDKLSHGGLAVHIGFRWLSGKTFHFWTDAWTERTLDSWQLALAKILAFMNLCSWTKRSNMKLAGRQKSTITRPLFFSKSSIPFDFTFSSKPRRRILLEKFNQNLFLKEIEFEDVKWGCVWFVQHTHVPTICRWTFVLSN